MRTRRARPRPETRAGRGHQDNLPSSITTNDGLGGIIATHLAYSASNQRVQKTSSLGTTDYFAELYERTLDAASGETTHKYFVAAGGQKIAQINKREQNGSLDEAAETTSYLHADALGSVVAISTESGLEHTGQEFSTFGERAPGAPPDARKVTPGYTGFEHDDELGLINARGRMYDPHVGRFASADPIVQAPGNRQSLNRYSYVFNNPVNLVDPSGFVMTHQLVE